VGGLVLFLPLTVLAFLAVVAAISGCVGGYIASVLLGSVRKIGLKQKLNLTR
jgi:hypothetical protein